VKSAADNSLRLSGAHSCASPESRDSGFSPSGCPGMTVSEIPGMTTFDVLTMVVKIQLPGVHGW
jgi:hypothetical protein